MHRRQRESAEKLEGETDRRGLLAREDKELELEPGEGSENHNEQLREISAPVLICLACCWSGEGENDGRDVG